MNKKRLIILIIAISVVIAVIAAFCAKNAPKADIDGTIYFTSINEKDEVKSFEYNISKDEIKEVTISGYKEIQNIKPFNNGFYCYGVKDDKGYLIRSKGGEIKSILTENDPDNAFDDIFIYNGLPLLERENNDTAEFYTVDFESGIKKIVYSTKDLPYKFLVVNNSIITYINYKEYSDDSGSWKYNGYGYINVYNGELCKIENAIEPVQYDERSFLYTTVENDAWKTVIYHTDTKETEEIDVNYIDKSFYSLEKAEPQVKLLNKQCSVYIQKVADFEKETNYLIIKDISNGKTLVKKEFKDQLLICLNT